jgi:hypothetical protein
MYVEGMPDEVFRFHKRELDAWYDGRPHRLTPGVDFPARFTPKAIKDRLVAAARKRNVDISVWFMDGNVHFVAAPWASFQGENPYNWT